jgi:hypothetical protein
MGFYIRKSIGLGPARLNLTNSGMGVSVGLKGARVSIGPKGAAFHAGRGGPRLDDPVRVGRPGPGDVVDLPREDELLLGAARHACRGQNARDNDGAPHRTVPEVWIPRSRVVRYPNIPAIRRKTK